jgi:hypothetical protein
MKGLWLIALLLVVLSVALSGCTSYTPIPEDYPMPVEGAEEVYDDVIATPGGLAYRANVRHIGEENPWPYVNTVRVEFNSVWLRYRDYIETEAGETRSNIFIMGREGGFWGNGSTLKRWAGRSPIWLELSAVSIPPGIELSQMKSGGSPGTLETVLVIEIAPDVTPGYYSLEIALEVKGRHYGTVPCIIEVVE